MELNLETIKQLMQLMNEHKIASLKFGELELHQSSKEVRQPTAKPDVIASQQEMDKAREEFEQRAAAWSMTGSFAPIKPNLKR